MIPIAKLRRSVAQRLRGSGEDWDFLFYAAINDVIQDMIIKTTVEVNAIDEDAPPTDLDVHVAHFKTFVEGISYYMQKSSKWARQGEDVSEMEYERCLADSQMFQIEYDDVPVGIDYEDD